MSGEKLCCCPPGSWPAFIPEADYDKQVKGSVVKVPIPNAPNKDDPTMRVYRTGNKDSKVVIVYVMDVFGLDHSRSKGIADTLSELTGGCEVLVPDILCEDWCQDLSTVMEWIKPFGWPEGIKPRMEAFLNHQEFNLTVAGDNKRKVVLVGFCYGTYIAANLCSKAFQKGFADANDGKTIDIICDVGYHPSNRLAPAFGQDEWALAEDSNEAIPHFLLATNDDPPGYIPSRTEWRAREGWLISSPPRTVSRSVIRRLKA